MSEECENDSFELSFLKFELVHQKVFVHRAFDDRFLPVIGCIMSNHYFFFLNFSFFCCLEMMHGTVCYKWMEHLRGVYLPTIFDEIVTVN